jgi:hypothetical protein
MGSIAAISAVVPAEKSKMRTPQAISKRASPRGSPRHTTDTAREIADVRVNSVLERVVRSVVAGIDAAKRLRRDALVSVMQTAHFWNGDSATG